MEVRTARGLENGATPAKNLGDRANVKPLEVSINQSLITLEHTDHLQIVKHRSPNNSADGRVHARRITS